MFYIQFQEINKLNTFHLLFCIQKNRVFKGNALHFLFSRLQRPSFEQLISTLFDIIKLDLIRQIKQTE